MEWNRFFFVCTNFLSIFEVLQTLTEPMPEISSLLLCGGSNVEEEMNAFKKDGGHVIVGTPKRIVDIFNRSSKSGINFSIGCKSLEVLILDEADRILQMGFADDLRTILAYLPKQRRTSLFSATQTTDVMSLVRTGMRNPISISVKQENEQESHKLSTPSTLSNLYMVCKVEEKLNVLISLLTEKKNSKILVFFATCASVEYFHEIIMRILVDYNIFGIHGKMKKKRGKVFKKFKNLESGILLCTDVMERGVDIPMVDWVIQFDPPSRAESFVHRCGRTARNNEEGSAILMVLPEEDHYIKFLEINQDVRLNPLEAPTDTQCYLKKMRAFQVSDRAIIDKASKAFVSYVQFYKKLEGNFKLMFKLEKLNLGLLAMGFGLLQLPFMPELKKYSTKDFVPSVIEKNNVAYKNKEKQKSHEKKVEIFKETGTWPTKKGEKPKPKETVSWSKNKEAKEKKQTKKLKREENFKRKCTEEELEELEQDLRLMKKHKKKKITDDEFEKQFMTEDDQLEAVP